MSTKANLKSTDRYMIFIMLSLLTTAILSHFYKSIISNCAFVYAYVNRWVKNGYKLNTRILLINTLSKSFSLIFHNPSWHSFDHSTFAPGYYS